jgi:hypothetical protein
MTVVHGIELNLLVACGVLGCDAVWNTLPSSSGLKASQHRRPQSTLHRRENLKYLCVFLSTVPYWYGSILIPFITDVDWIFKIPKYIQFLFILPGRIYNM